MSAEFYALLAVEGLRTVDARIVKSGGLTWPAAPIPLRYMRGRLHDGTEIAGTIIRVTRLDCWVLAQGAYLDTENGEWLREEVEIAARSGTPLGIGVDLETVLSDLTDDGLEIAGNVIAATVYAYADGSPAWPQCRIVPAPKEVAA